MSGALLGKRTILVTAELVSLLGAANAIVLQQVAWWSIDSKRSDEGRVTMSQAELSRSTGLSKSALYRSLTWLREQGWVSSEGQDGVELAYSLTAKASGLIDGGTVAESSRSVAKPRRSPSRKRDGKAEDTTYRGITDMDNGTGAGALSGTLDLVAGPEPEGARSVERAVSDPAREVLDFAWERRKAAGKALPTVRGNGSPYMAVLQVVRKLLEAGNDPELVALTLFDHDSAWTVDSLNVTLGKVKSGRATDPRLAAAMKEKRVADEVARLRAEAAG